MGKKQASSETILGSFILKGHHYRPPVCLHKVSFYDWCLRFHILILWRERVFLMCILQRQKGKNSFKLVMFLIEAAPPNYASCSLSWLLWRTVFSSSMTCIQMLQLICCSVKWILSFHICCPFSISRSEESRSSLRTNSLITC